MSRKTILIAGLFLFIFTVLVFPVSGNTKISELDPKYRDFLDLTHYIITPMEKQAFLSLKNNRERDALIKLFWKQRDPTRGTPENEFQKEHAKRFRHASRYFRFGSPVPGWKTDRGRIYILLGPPVSEDEVITNGLHPVLIWDYYGNSDNGLPTHFQVVFYKRNGTGQYRIYMPTIDGPLALLTAKSHNIDPMNYEAMYEAVREYSTTVAEVSLSLIPGERLNGYNPSMQGAFLISRIYELPKRSVNATYARNFVNYKGIVNVDVVTNYVNSRFEIGLSRDMLFKTHFLHFAFLPERLSVDYSEAKDKYYFNYELTVVLRKKNTNRGKESSEVFKYTKNFPYYASKEEIETRLSHGMVIADYLPVVPGKYSFSAVLQNSVNREISYCERDIVVPGADSNPVLYGPFAAYRIMPAAGNAGFGAFQIADRILSVDPRKSFGMEEPVELFFSVFRGNESRRMLARVTVVNDLELRPYKKEYRVDIPVSDTLSSHTLKIENPGNGDYSVNIRLEDSAGRVLQSRDMPLAISPVKKVIHPPVASKRLRPENRFVFDMMQAVQYHKTRRFAEAGTHFEKALQGRKDFLPLIKAYAAFLLERKQPERLLQIIQPLKGVDAHAFDYHSLRGKALHVQGNNVQAVEELLEANRLYDSDTSVLNALGAALANTGDLKEARRALEASLLLNPEQLSVKKQLSRLKGGKK